MRKACALRGFFTEQIGKRQRASPHNVFAKDLDLDAVKHLPLTTAKYFLLTIHFETTNLFDNFLHNTPKTIEHIKYQNI